MKNILTKSMALICALMLLSSLFACGAKNDVKEETASTETQISSAVEISLHTESSSDINTEESSSHNSSLIGSWDYAELSGMIYTFNADGSGTYDMFGEVMEFTYEADGSTLKITYTDEDVDAPMELEYVIEGDTLNVKDSLGNDTIYKRKTNG